MQLVVYEHQNLNIISRLVFSIFMMYRSSTTLNELRNMEQRSYFIFSLFLWTGSLLEAAVNTYFAHIELIGAFSNNSNFDYICQCHS